MNCPNTVCNADFDKIIVLESRQGTDHVRRRRKCLNCQHRFTTVELKVELKRGNAYHWADYTIVNRQELERIKSFIKRQIQNSIRLAKELSIDLDLK
jgi:transcriptional regulator NrdR family protein